MSRICYICEKSGNEVIHKSDDHDLCYSCYDLVQRGKRISNATEAKKALSEAYDSSNNCFKCYYTGIPCKIDLSSKDSSSSFKHAFDLTFDHKDPIDGVGKGNEIVVCLNIINRMKTNIPSYTFKSLVICIADHFQNNIDSDELEENIRSYLTVD